jgi:hypothetical protein
MTEKISNQSTEGKKLFAIVIFGLFIRLLWWWTQPASIGDEVTYVAAGLRLATTGQQDTLFPPVTSWLVALLAIISGSTSVLFFRFFWIMLDIGNMLLLQRLVKKWFTPFASVFSHSLTIGLSNLVIAFYAIYVPAIGYSECVTSEIPALFLILSMLVLLDRIDEMSIFRAAFAGLVCGIIVLTRSNLITLLLTIPCAMLITAASGRILYHLRTTFVFILVGSAVVGTYISLNYYTTGQWLLSANAPLCLYVGNADVYQEDLNLFYPWATPEQIKLRHEMLTGTQKPLDLTIEQMQHAAIKNIREHPLLFLRRALGRLARVFVPKTGPLLLVGGERNVEIFSPIPMALLITALIQYGFILFFGFAGMLCLHRFSRILQVLFGAIIIGSLLLCLVAISKPRYSAPFEPILIICAFVFILDFRKNLSYIWQERKVLFGIIVAFFIWAWSAWLIFSSSSRFAS